MKLDPNDRLTLLAAILITIGVFVSVYWVISVI